jgi:putative ABC transport system permease protein
VLHLAKERTRSAYTLALVMLVMAMALATASLWTSFTQSFDRGLERIYGDDLGLLASSAVTPAFLAALEDHPAIDPDAYLQVADFGMVDGDRASLAAALRAGGALVLPAPAAERLGVGRGDTVTLRTTDGELPFTVAATVEFNNSPTTIHVGAVDGRERFGIAGSRNLVLGVADGWEPAAAAEAVEADLGHLATFITVSTDDRKADTRAQIAGGLNGFIVLILLTAVVGAFGLANTLAVSITQRSREIGVLRAIGARRRQVQAVAVVEAATLVAVAFVLAVPLGALISGPLLRTVAATIGDFTLEHRLPWASVPLLALAGAVIGAAAAGFPARRAAALDIDTALRFE